MAYTGIAINKDGHQDVENVWMLKYKTIIFGIAAIASAIFALWTSNEDYSAYFVISGLFFGAITCLLITLKMMASKTVKTDPKQPPPWGFGGG